jgi:hypothetical protein
MPNSLSASFPTRWAREMQEKFWTKNVFRPQANFRLESDLKDGDTVKRVYRSATVPQDYTRGSDVTFQDLTNTAETLTVDKQPVIPFYIDDLDALQSHYDERARYTEDTTNQMANIINGWYTAEVVNATSTIDAADFGGTASTGAIITLANIQKLFALAQKKVSRLNTWSDGKMFANLTPDLYQVLLEYLSGKESALGDKTGENGHMGRYYGFDLYVSNGGYWTGRLGIATQPTDGDTVTINGVTFTFKTTLGSTAGNVLIGASNDTALTNLAALINAPGTTTAQGVALSADNQAKLYGATATADTTNNILTLTYRGVGAPVVSETLTAAADTWVTGYNISHNMFGVKGAVDFVIQKQPGIQIEKAENRLGYKVIPYTLFGRKTFADGAKKLLNVKVDTTQYT